MALAAQQVHHVEHEADRRLDEAVLRAPHRTRSARGSTRAFRVRSRRLQRDRLAIHLQNLLATLYIYAYSNTNFLMKYGTYGYLLHCIDDGYHFANRTDNAVPVGPLFTSALLAATSTSRRRPSTQSDCSSAYTNSTHTSIVLVYNYSVQCTVLVFLFLWL